MSGRQGNYACYPPHTSEEEMKASCCAAGLQQCVSVAYNTAAGGGCSKRNDDGGWLNTSGFVDYAIKTGHEQPVTGASHLEVVPLVLHTQVVHKLASAKLKQIMCWGARPAGSHLYEPFRYRVSLAIMHLPTLLIRSGFNGLRSLCESCGDLVCHL